MKSIKKIFIIILVIVCLSCSIISISAANPQINIVYEQALSEVFSFEELGNLASGDTWVDVVDYFTNTLGVGNDTDFLFWTAESSVGDIVCVSYDYNIDQQLYRRDFTLHDASGDNVLLSDIVNEGETYYLQYTTLECDHEFESVSETHDSKYCFYDICMWCRELNYREHDLIQTHIVEPTCTSIGTASYLCSAQGCGYTETITIPKLKHEFVMGEYILLMPTCTENGTKLTEYCSNCLEYKSCTVIPALGHDLSQEVIIVEATCTTNGITEGFCDRCGESEVLVVTPRLGHDWSKPTCTEPGVCKRCQETSAELGHDIKFNKCTRCDYRMTAKEVIKNYVSDPFQNIVNNILKNNKNTANDQESDQENIGDKFENFFNNLLGKDNDSDTDNDDNFWGDWIETGKVILMGMFLIPILILIYAIFYFVIKVTNLVNRNKDK